MNFLNSKPPPNYVAGLGRGATGFTTRSDIGPARAASTTIGDPEYQRGKEPANYEDDDDFELFESYRLFNFDQDDADDKEADEIWDDVENKMRRVKRNDRIHKKGNSNPKFTGIFSGLKDSLYTLSTKDWESLDEFKSGCSSMNKKKKARFESFVPVPDTLLEKAIHEKQRVSSIGETRDLSAVGEGRGAVLSLKLDSLSDSVSGMTTVDPKRYLSVLNSCCDNFIASDANFMDFKKARLLLKSITRTNPKYAHGWIAAARLEELAGKVKEARLLMKKGCEECRKNEDVWLEACRLADPREARSVISKGVRFIPDSVKLWMRASDLEEDDIGKSRVLRRGLECLPNSVRLWKAVVELANEEDARLLLDRAVELCPLHVELWLALARLETYDNAKKVLNRAKEVLPKEPGVWITEAKLEEAKGNTDKVGEIIQRALQEGGVVIDREAWMKEAETAERGGFVETCRAIIKNTIGIEVEEEDRKRTWVADAEECEKRNSIETARAIYDHALNVFLTKKSIWIKAAQLERVHGTMESLYALLRKAITYIPQAEDLWLMCAKDKWLAGDVPQARALLQEAYAAIPNSEELWLAAFKLEFENHEPERARMLLAKARDQIGGTERVWMKSAIVERELGNVEQERRMLNEGLKKFPAFYKMWLMLGQLEERLSETAKRQDQPEKRHSHMMAAKEVYESGLKNCPNSVPLWLSHANLEEEMNGLSKVRAILTMARNKNPQNPELWLAAIRVELKHGYRKEADALMAKALQECPNSGILWAASIEMAPHPQRKTKSKDAVKKCNCDPHVIAAAAKLLWHRRKVDKARTFLNTAVTLAPDIGDFWALCYKFEQQHGTEENLMDVLKRCVAAKPKHGEKWQAVSKALENAHQRTESILMKVVKYTSEG